MQSIQDISIDKLLKYPAIEDIRQVMGTIEVTQEHLYALYNSDDSNRLKLVKIATVFHIFLIETLASGKRPKDLTEEDWKEIAGKISQYAIMGSGEQYSEFVFTLYAEYISVSADNLPKVVSEKSVASVKELSESIRFNTNLLKEGELSEIDYVEGCLWLSLEAMIKLLSCYLTSGIGEEFSYFAQSASQLAFEYGRMVLFSKEQMLLDSYIQNQYQLNEELKEKWEQYTTELQTYSAEFKGLIDAAFSSDIHNALVNSSVLAREAGVKEDKILATISDIDDFFME